MSRMETLLCYESFTENSNYSVIFWNIVIIFFWCWKAKIKKLIVKNLTMFHSFLLFNLWRCTYTLLLWESFHKLSKPSVLKSWWFTGTRSYCKSPGFSIVFLSRVSLSRLENPIDWLERKLRGDALLFVSLKLLIDAVDHHSHGRNDPVLQNKNVLLRWRCVPDLCDSHNISPCTMCITVKTEREVPPPSTRHPREFHPSQDLQDLLFPPHH